MNPIESITSVFRNYVNFSGRAQRSEFWWFTLFSFIMQALLNLAPVVGWIFGLAVLLPSLAVTARRLHDTGRSAWWLMIYPVLILGWIIGVVIFVVFVITAVWEPGLESDRETRNRLESEFGVRVSQAELELLREACGEYEELSEAELEEKEAICDEITVSWSGTIGGVIFLAVWGLVSAAGVITLLILCALPGTVGPNRYGPDPLQPRGGAGGPYNNPYTPPTATGGYSTVGQPPPAPSAPDSAPDPSQRRYCTRCGTQLQADAQFCTYCGTAI